MGVVNAAGEEVSGFPPPKTYYSANTWNGYFIANSVNPNGQTKENRGVEYLLDRDFNELKSFEWVSGVYGNIRGDYLAYHNGDDWGIYHPAEGDVFTSNGASIEYFDGKLAIVQTGSYRSEEGIEASLVTQEHKELAGGFSWLIPAQLYDDKEPAEKFLGLTGEKAVLIGRDGNVLASSAELPGARSLNMLCYGLYTYQIETDSFYGTGLLGPDLEVLVPADSYTGIDLCYTPDGPEWSGTENAWLRANKEIGDSNAPGQMIYRMDILDHTGNLIADNVTDVYDVGPDRIALRRGFNVGLIDRNGNWIVKRSIFTRLGDD